MNHFLAVKQFYNKSEELRQYYEEVFAKPLEATSERFCWDYWNVPDSYTHLRTPAWEFFPEDIYTEWHNALLKFGREQLGCFEVTPPWMSCYVEGCKQNLHADLPHGPWAYVYSLTPSDRGFIGGQTKIMKPEMLEYWANFERSSGLGPSDIFDKIEPDFNQLLVFDPRFPHGVEEVRGTHDVNQGRLVIHGWFTEPRPWVDGPLDEDENLPDALNQLIDQVVDGIDAFDGLVTFRIEIEADGKVASVKVLSNTLIGLEGEIPLKAIENFQFPKASGKSVLTLPLIFS